MTIRIFDDLGSLSTAAAEFFVLRAREAVEATGRFTVALAGGSTPKALYRLLAESPYRDFVAWDRTFVFFGDERWVAADDPESNEGMARASFLNSVPVPADQVFPMHSSKSRDEACADYEAVLRKHAPNGLDLVLLGMGDDGHTASLFPGISELDEAQRWVVATTSPKGVPERISLTFPALEMSHSILFLIAGAAKHAELEKAVSHDSTQWPPSGRLIHGSKAVHLYIDEAAAGGTVSECLAQ